MKKNCKDCGTVITIKPKGHNKVRCVSCRSLRKLRDDRKRSRERRINNPLHSQWYKKQRTHETTEEKDQKIIDSLTWERLEIETPVLDRLYERKRFPNRV